MVESYHVLTDFGKKSGRRSSKSPSGRFQTKNGMFQNFAMVFSFSRSLNLEHYLFNKIVDGPRQQIES